MRFPFIKQHDSMECGVACLTMILQWYGKHTSLSSVAEQCPPTTEGVSLSGLAQTARRYGMEAVAARATIDELAQSTLPAIIHWQQNHFTVLYRVSSGRRRRFYVSDPAKGRVCYSEAEFEAGWLSTASQGMPKGIALFLAPGEGFDAANAGADGGERRSFGFLLSYLRTYRRYFMHIVAGLALGCLLQLILPFMTQAIVDVGIKNGNISLIWLILLGELMIVIGRTATDFIRRWLLLHISMRINISLVSDFFIKLLRLPMAFFDTRKTGDLLQRMADHGRVQQFLTGQVLGVLFTLLSFVIFGVVLLVYNRLIFAVFVLGSIVYGVWIATFLHRRKVLDYELFEQQARNQNYTYQFISSMQEIKLQDCERRRRWEWEDVQADLFGVQMKSMKLQQSQEAGSIFINEVKNIIITVLAATAVINGQMTLGSMLAVQYIIGQLNSPVEQLMAFIYSLQDVKISLERINEIHQGKDEEADRGQLSAFDAGARKSIAIENLSFRYDRFSPGLTIDNISLDIPAGRTTAIVGASGSGKTTLIKLLLGYYRPESGRISVAGRNIDDYSLRWWRRQCGTVMQDGVIFSESIARNIAVDDGDIDCARLESAARLACIHDYIESLPLRYNTRIGRDGMGLSQGQKQRILIARAVYRNPDFIFLDEATNALDAGNERAIVENLDEFYRGRTVVVVAHRLSTVRNASRIVVLDGGRIAEQGTHYELIARRGVYFNLVKNQLELGS
ncbi:MAG: peptidase domain-containing ABC transporter [Muribaculaceae bacterium]|nr:peptidase domain-containing ABC transporter [Muribaculaceae bacterium]